MHGSDRLGQHVQGGQAGKAGVRASVKSKEHTRHCFMLTCLLFPTFAWSPVMHLMAVATTLRTTIGARSTMHSNLYHVMITIFVQGASGCGQE